MTMTRSLVHDLLVAARGYVERGWTQRHFAVAEDGRDVPARSKEACSWCALGAVQRASVDLPMANTDTVYVASQALAKVAQRNMAIFNDMPERTQQEILDLFDKAIESYLKD